MGWSVIRSGLSKDFGITRCPAERAGELQEQHDERRCPSPSDAHARQGLVGGAVARPGAGAAGVGIRPGMEAVDLCCSDGHFTRPICERVRPGRAWAVDLDADLLRQTEEACRGHANLRPVLGDARALPAQIGAPADFVSWPTPSTVYRTRPGWPGRCTRHSSPWADSPSSTGIAARAKIPLRRSIPEGMSTTPSQMSTTNRADR